MKVVFFGTPLFAAHVLEYLLENGIQVAAVISKPDRPKGRSGHPIATPVKALVRSKYPFIPVYQPEIVSAPEFAEVLTNCQADLFLVVAYGEILKQSILDMPRLACINLHASLLPQYRGAAPIQRSIIEGETRTGITIMHMVKKMDAGDMIKQVVVPILPDMTYGELESQLCEVGKKALLEVVHEFESGVPESEAQDPSLVTFAHKIEAEDCEIHWNQPAEAIHNLVRGVNPHPGAWCLISIKGEKKRLKIIRTALGEVCQQFPGQIVSGIKHELKIAARDRSVLLLEVQLEGKKPISGNEFLRGFSAGLLVF